MANTTNSVFLILHGWGGNKPEHWQEHLYRKLTEAGATVHYPKFPNPTAPDLNAWQQTLQAELDEIAQRHGDAPVTVLAHSLGGINWMHYAAKSAAIGKLLADRVLLVAPPYVLPQAPPPDAPESVTMFFPPPLDPQAIARVARQTVLVASDTDDYATFDQSSGYAAKLNIPIEKLPGGGHISPYYGYGEWPWVLEWAMARADFPPQPNK